MDGKPVALVNVISVAELLLPLVSSANAPFKVVVNDPKILPLHGCAWWNNYYNG